MPHPLVEIVKGDLSIRTYKKDAITLMKRRELPLVPGVYVLRCEGMNYVGQSIDAFGRVLIHLKKNSFETATVIQYDGSAIDNEWLIHVEFGLILILMGCDRTLANKQTDLPFGSVETRQRALSFLKLFLDNFTSFAPHLIGSKSYKNQLAVSDSLHYLRTVWTDR